MINPVPHHPALVACKLLYPAREQRPSQDKSTERTPLPPVIRLHLVLQLDALQRPICSSYQGVASHCAASVSPLCVLSSPPAPSPRRNQTLPAPNKRKPEPSSAQVAYLLRFPFLLFHPILHPSVSYDFQIFNRCSVLVAVAPQHHRPPRTPELPSGAPTASPTSPHHALSVSSLAPRSCAILYAISITHRRTGQPRKHTDPEYIICLGTALG